ncbi:MAG TPA: NUDIX domain-containing protein [Candidatus Latescibacteria bacterium]|nr:NUDIX domain-containing protein [Candidatus Latescibacterota bacterium]
MIEEVIRHLETPSALKEVVFVLFDANTFSAFERAISEHLEYTEGKTQCNPIPTVDVIIEMDDGIVLIRRKNPPYGWAIPGGFVDYGESLEEAVVREAKEETGLDLEGLRQFHTYSDPTRDPRGHTISTVFVARGRGIPKASDDAEELRIFNRENLPEELAFDHKKIIDDYFKAKLETGSNFLKR